MTIERQYLAIHQVITEACRQPTSGRFYSVEQKRMKEAVTRLGYRKIRSGATGLRTCYPQAPSERSRITACGQLAEAHFASILFRSTAGPRGGSHCHQTLPVASWQLTGSLDAWSRNFWPKVPRDRMDGKPLRYRVNPQAGLCSTRRRMESTMAGMERRPMAVADHAATELAVWKGLGLAQRPVVKK